MKVKFLILTVLTMTSFGLTFCFAGKNDSLIHEISFVKSKSSLNYDVFDTTNLKITETGKFRSKCGAILFQMRTSLRFDTRDYGIGLWKTLFKALELTRREASFESSGIKLVKGKKLYFLSYRGDSSKKGENDFFLVCSELYGHYFFSLLICPRKIRGKLDPFSVSVKMLPNKEF